MKMQFTITGSRRSKSWDLIKSLNVGTISEDWEEVFVEVPIWSGGKIKPRLTQVMEPVYKIEFNNIKCN